MAYDTSNPVNIGDPTKKAHYDELWDNTDWLRQVMTKSLTPWHATALNSNILLPGLVIRPKFTFVESLDFTLGGVHELVVGDTVEGETGGATGYVAHIELTGGTWGGGDAAGTLYLHTRNAIAFQAAETLKDNGNLNIATVTAASSKDSILISSFIYHHAGATNQLLYSDVNIAYEFANLAASDWSYLYFDDSSIGTAGTNLITASELVDVVNEPAPSQAKHGEYNGTDRCLFAVRTNAGSEILEFFHVGELVYYADQISDINGVDIDDAWTDAPLTIPKFAREAQITFYSVYLALSGEGDWRTNGQTGAIGHRMYQLEINNERPYNTVRVITDDNQIIEVKYGAADGNEIMYGFTDGWYFPVGM